MVDNKVEVTIGAVLSKGFKGAFKSAGKEVSDLEGKLDKLSRQKSALRNLSTLQKNTKRAGQEFQQAQTKLRMLQMQSDRAGNASKKLSKNIERSKKEVSSAKREYDKYNKELKEAEANTRRLGLSTNRLANQYRKTSRELRKLGKERDRVNRKESRRAALEGAGGRLAGAGAGLLAAGAVGAAIGSQVLQPSLNLGATLSTVQAADQSISVDQLEKLRGQALKLGSTTQFTAVQASQGMLALVKAGLSAQQTMASLPGVLDFATAGSLELGQAAEVTANAMAQFRIEASEASRVGDVFSLAANKSTIDVTDLVESMKFLGPAAAAVGTSIEEASAIVAVLGNQGFRGGIATRALSTAMLRLAKPTAEMKKTMGQLGVEVFDSSGKFIGLTKTFEILEKRLAGASDEKKLNVLGAIFGGESAKQALGLLNAGTTEIKNMTKALEDSRGSAEKFAKIKLDNLMGDITLLSSAIEGLFTVLGGGSGFFLRPLVQGLTSLVQVITNVISSVPFLKEIIGGLAIAGIAAATILGSLGLIIGGISFGLSQLAPLMAAIATIGGMIQAASIPFLLLTIGNAVAIVVTGLFVLKGVFERLFKFIGESETFREFGSILMETGKLLFNIVGMIFKVVAPALKFLGKIILDVLVLPLKLILTLLKPIIAGFNLIAKLFGGSQGIAGLNNSIEKGRQRQATTESFQSDVAARTQSFDVAKVNTFGNANNGQISKSVVMDNRVVVNAEGVQDPQAVADLVSKQQSNLRNLFNVDEQIGATMQ